MGVKLWFSGNPIPWGTNIAPDGHRYVAPKTRDWQESVHYQLFCQWKRRPLKGDVGVEYIFFRESKLRVDIKNLMAAMEDVFTGVLFEDDSQVKVTKQHLRYDKERPGVEVTVWEL